MQNRVIKHSRQIAGKQPPLIPMTSIVIETEKMLVLQNAKFALLFGFDFVVRHTPVS